MVKKTLNKVARVKTLKGWKTVGFNTAALVLPGILGLGGELLNVPEIQGLIPPHYVPLYMAGVGVANVLLRYVTTSPVGKKL